MEYANKLLDLYIGSEKRIKMTGEQRSMAYSRIMKLFLKETKTEI